MLVGVLLGFVAAIFQSISYLCTKIFIKHHKTDIGALLALSHIIMGVISVPLVWFLKPDQMPDYSTYQWKLLNTAGFYLLGQFFLFAALIKTEASRVSPLLGLKIVILALISVVFLQHPMSPTKWVAIGCSSLAAFLLSNSGGRIHLSSIVLVLCACLFYSLSDIHIKMLVDHFGYLGILRGALLSTGLTYILCAIVGGIYVIFKFKDLHRETWGYSLPFALSWLIAMFFLYTCFALIGVVFGNIIQSSRGIISIGLGYLIANIGFERLEPKITRGVYLRRVLAGLLMTGAVALYYWSH